MIEEEAFGKPIASFFVLHMLRSKMRQDLLDSFVMKSFYTILGDLEDFP